MRIKTILTTVSFLFVISVSANNNSNPKDSIKYIINTIDTLVFQPVHLVFSSDNISVIKENLDEMEKISMNIELNKRINRKSKTLLVEYINITKQFIYYSDFSHVNSKEEEKKKGEWSVFYEPKIMHNYLDRYIKASTYLNHKYRPGKKWIK